MYILYCTLQIKQIKKSLVTNYHQLLMWNCIRLTSTHIDYRHIECKSYHTLQTSIHLMFCKLFALFNFQKKIEGEKSQIKWKKKKKRLENNWSITIDVKFKTQNRFYRKSIFFHFQDHFKSLHLKHRFRYCRSCLIAILFSLFLYFFQLCLFNHFFCFRTIGYWQLDFIVLLLFSLLQ